MVFFIIIGVILFKNNFFSRHLYKKIKGEGKKKERKIVLIKKLRKYDIFVNELATASACCMVLISYGNSGKGAHLMGGKYTQV